MATGSTAVPVRSDFIFTMSFSALFGSVLRSLFFLLLGLSNVDCSSLRPNFIFLFADDLGFGDLKSYGHPYAQTDHLDRLAAEGTAFHYFHVAGYVCPTSRAGFMTSRHPSWFPNYTPDFGFEGAMTVTQVLQDAGYVTGHIGKWNIGDPTPDSSDREYEPYGISDLRITGDGNNLPEGKEHERYDLAIDFVEEHKDEPFYLNVWMYAVHSPVEPPKYLVEKFDGLEVDRSDFDEYMQEKFDDIKGFGKSIDLAMQTYLGEVYGMDQEIGRLLTRLDELGLTNNTIVMFSSDNGPSVVDERDEFTKASWGGGFRGGKFEWYEAGIRVPFIIRWPGHIPAGKVNKESFTSALDWLPTVATLAGVQVPWNLTEGEDVSDIWFGSDRSRKDPTFYQHPGKDEISVHYNGWKSYDWNQELYNLKEDPAEKDNLYESRRDIVDALKDLKAQYKQTIPSVHKFEGQSAVDFDPTQPVQEWIIPEVLLEPTESPTTAPSSSSTTFAPTTSSPSLTSTPSPSLAPVVSTTPETTQSPSVGDTIAPTSATLEPTTSDAPSKQQQQLGVSIVSCVITSVLVLLATV